MCNNHVACIFNASMWYRNRKVNKAREKGKSGTAPRKSANQKQTKSGRERAWACTWTWPSTVACTHKPAPPPLAHHTQMCAHCLPAGHAGKQKKSSTEGRSLQANGARGYILDVELCHTEKIYMYVERGRFKVIRPKLITHSEFLMMWLSSVTFHSFTGLKG